MKNRIVDSNQNMFCAVNEKDKKVTIAFRGTSKLVDLVHDIGVVGGTGAVISVAGLAKTAGLSHR